MKHINLLKQVRKLAKVEKNSNGQYFASYGNREISWWEQNEETVCVRVRRKEDKDDFQSDYCAGAFYDTIKHAIAALTR